MKVYISRNSSSSRSLGLRADVSKAWGVSSVPTHALCVHVRPMMHDRV